MGLPERSLDDLPLQAYVAGVDGVVADADDVANETGDDGSMASTPAGASDVALDATAEPLGSSPFAIPAAPADGPRPDVVVRAETQDKATLREVLRDPRAHARDPRLIAVGAAVVAVVLIGGNLAGGGPAAGAPTASTSPTAPTVAVTQPDPPSAMVELTGGVVATYSFAAMTGEGSAGAAAMSPTWTDATGTTLAIAGSVQRGTRTTDSAFTLALTALVEGKPVSFLSKAGECTIGMAVTGSTISGTFTCPKLKSADGKVTIRATGTYRT